jgi:predicted phosphodiesterase
MGELTSVAAIYDIHGNLPALEAALAEIAREGVDLILVGGDVAIGPHPAETIALLASLGDRLRFVRGNGDRELVAAFDEKRSEGPASWEAGRIDQAARDFLAAFEETVTLDIAGLGPVLFCHGTPRSDTEIVTVLTPDERFRAVLAGVETPLIVCGHTHIQFDRAVDDRRVVNAGSVGMPYQGTPGAFWLKIGPDLFPRRTAYDAERAARQIIATGYPDAEELIDTLFVSPPSAEDASAHFESLATP